MPDSRFPLYYHLHHNQHMEDLPFWLELAREQGGNLLELGCGTGRLLAHFVEDGCHAIGLDIDFRMLDFLQKVWPKDIARPAILQADMAHYHLNTFFDLIILPCNTLSTLSQASRLATFACAATHLSANGIFAASLPNPRLLTKLPSMGDSEVEDFFPSPEDGEPVQVSSAWERAGAEFTVIWHYDHLLTDGRVVRSTLRTCHALVDPSIYFDELRKVGLRVISFYGDFDKSLYSPNAPQLIFMAGLV